MAAAAARQSESFAARVGLCDIVIFAHHLISSRIADTRSRLVDPCRTRRPLYYLRTRRLSTTGREHDGAAVCYLTRSDRADRPISVIDAYFSDRAACNATVCADWCLHVVGTGFVGIAVLGDMHHAF